MSKLISDYMTSHFPTALLRYATATEYPNMRHRMIERSSDRISFIIDSLKLLVYHRVKFRDKRSDSIVDFIHIQSTHRDRQGHELLERFDVALACTDIESKIQGD